MKVGNVIIFIVIQVITCEKAVSKLRKKLIVPKMNDECKKIKCPSVEELVCVKMTRHDLGRSMHVVAANRCELDYIKCHDDVEAKVVPMKYCGHHAALSVGNKKNKTGKHIRVKRGVPSIKSTDNAFEMLKQIKREEEKESKLSPKSINLAYKEDLQLNDVEEIQPKLSLHLDDFNMFSEESTNISKELMDAADRKEYESSCPTVCPSRDVMVCGRCQHGVYKTFISVCHMKMFSCNHDDEVMELISRYPCLLSAPYLSEEMMKPKGRIREAGDDDEILKFLKCQERGGTFVKDLKGKLSCASGLLKDPAERYKDGDRFFYFPGDGDNTMHLVDSTEPIDFEFIKKFTKNPANYGYWLYTRYNTNDAQIIKFGDASSVAHSNFNSSKVTVFLAHGWRGNGKNEMNVLLTEDADINVIVLDWSELAQKYNYCTARQGTAAVGRGLGKFVKWLVSLGASYDIIHLVGFSLGAHLVGNAGRETGSAVRRITALDPAFPGWSNDNERVVHTDARYVEVIHTNGRLYGWSSPCGHTDFYPNGGYTQPGCFLNLCSHSRAWKYMASSVKNNHLLANKCATLREAFDDKCTGVLYPMGNSDLSKSSSGIFRVNTSKDWPY